MIIKMTYEVPMHNKDVKQFGTSFFDGVSEHHVRETYTPDGEREVDIDFVDTKGNKRSFQVTGTAYIMSDAGKTVDTIRGGVVPKGVAQDYGDDYLGAPSEQPQEPVKEKSVE